jgi:hypothetical protein
MTHREDPDRGVYMTACELCGYSRACRLVMHGDRYLWQCIGDCIKVVRR